MKLKLPLPTLACTLIASGVLSVLPAARGALLALDNFSSYNPPISLQDLNGGTGFSGGYAVGAPSQGYLNIVRNDQPLSYPNTTGLGGNYANLAGGYGGPAFNYFQRALDVNGSFSALKEGADVGADNKVVWGSFAYHTANGTLNLFLQSGVATNFFALPSNGNTDSFYLYRIAFGTNNVDTISFYNNPDLSTFDPNSVPTSSVTGDYSFRNIGFAVNGDTHEGRVDNIRFGDTPEDVGVVPVPEPATWVAGVLASAVITFRARRVRRRRGV